MLDFLLPFLLSIMPWQQAVTVLLAIAVPLFIAGVVGYLLIALSTGMLLIHLAMNNRLTGILCFVFCLAVLPITLLAVSIIVPVLLV